MNNNTLQLVCGCGLVYGMTVCRSHLFLCTDTAVEEACLSIADTKDMSFEMLHLQLSFLRYACSVLQAYIAESNYNSR